MTKKLAVVEPPHSFGIEEFVARLADNVRQKVMGAQAEWHTAAGIDLSDVVYCQRKIQQDDICEQVAIQLLKRKRGLV